MKTNIPKCDMNKACYTLPPVTNPEMVEEEDKKPSKAKKAKAEK